MTRKNRLKDFFKRLIGGRPMRHLAHGFHDPKTNKGVHIWEDTYGRRWLATNRWGWYRVAAGSRPSEPQQMNFGALVSQIAKEEAAGKTQ